MLLPVGSLDEKPGALGPGSVVAGHVLERELGRGGMGVVFLARHAETGAERAVKVVEVASDPELALRFLCEAEAMARADGHPNVVRVFSAGREGTRLHLVMERILGGDLGHLLAREGPPPVERAVEWTLGLCAAVAHHARGVLHRDLKPQNVLLDGDRPKLADFGLARLAGADALTRTGHFVGSPAYMAPEQASGGEPDERTDVYGLGGVLYALLCGRPPFGGGTANAVSELLGRRPDPPSSHRPGVPAALEAVCLRCLEKEPGARYARAVDLARDLERWRRGELAPRRAGLVAAGAAGLVGIAALGAGWAAWSAPVAAPLPSAEVAEVSSTDGERARDDYLRAVSGVLGPGAGGLQRRLEELARRLSPPELEALAPRKREALAEVARGASVELAARVAEHRKAGPLLDALAAVSQATPAVALPPALEELLDDALRARLVKLDWRKQSDVSQLVDFELRRARALDHRRRPPPELRDALERAFGARGGEFPLPWLRACLWADCDGLVSVGVLSPREALRAVPDGVLDDASAETPGSQALALVRLERALHRTERTSAGIQRVGLAAWRRTTADGELASSDPPTDLGPRWIYLARRLTMRVLFLRTCERLHDTPAEATAILERTIVLGREVMATCRPRIGEATVQLPVAAELREATECAASSLFRLGRVRECLAVWDEALATLTPLLGRPRTDSETAEQVREALRGATWQRVEADDPGAAAIARLALELARTPREERSAVVDLLRAHVDVSALRPHLAAVDAELLGDEERYRARIARVDDDDTGGKMLVLVAVQSALALGDRPLARTRAELAIGLYPDLEDELTPLLRQAEGR